MARSIGGVLGKTEDPEKQRGRWDLIYHAAKTKVVSSGFTVRIVSRLYNAWA